MNIQGRDCTLTVARDGEFIPLPYSEETVRLASKGYSLPGCIGERNREKTVVTHREIEGCFVTRLEYLNVLPLFLLFFNSSEKFDLYADRGFEKTVYKNVLPQSFELRADNKDAFKIRVNVKSSRDSYVTEWPLNTPNLSWKEIAGSSPAMTQGVRTYSFDGHFVTADLRTLPLVYRFELNGSFTEKTNFKITLYFPLSEKHYPTQGRIEKLNILIDHTDGMSIDLYNLVPVTDLCDINCPDTVLCFQTFNILGDVILNIRNQEQNTHVLL